MSYMEQFNFWVEDSYFDEETKKELLAIKDNEKEIEDRFYKELEFGTGGLRGVIGAGTNRMNIYTVRKATQGLANYILKQGGAEKGIAIAYDSRRMSPEFADEAALCMAANGIKAYVFDALRPTPELSFAIRKLGCISGIVVTASHNPPEYNGYKVYWEDGAQIVSPYDKEIIDEVNKIQDLSEIKIISESDVIFVHFWASCFSQVIELKKTYGFKLAVDFDVYRDFDVMEKFSPFVDFFMISGSEEYLPQFKKLSYKYECLFNISLAERGSVTYYKGKEFKAKAVKVDTVIDTTGCGDSYHAGFVCSYILEKDIEKAMSVGSEIAAETLMHYGGF